jgi:hypothetical protein
MRKGFRLNSNPGDAHDRPMWLDVMLELSYLAFATDTTRVITFEWAREAGGLGVGGEKSPRALPSWRRSRDAEKTGGRGSRIP